jgi:carboxylesterase type B
VYRATTYNSSGRYYSFNNIRFAAPPTGDLRFRAPVAPARNRTAIQTGSVDRICAQASPAWELLAAEWLPKFLTTGRVDTNFSLTIPGISPGTQSPSAAAAQAFAGIVPAQDPRTTEDCLFLDVVVPEGIFSSRNRGYGAPVLVWIYGGGYTAGSKSDSGNPAGLLDRSENNGGQGVIYVAMNYRLGAFGWQSGPTFQADGTANVGLYDQRFALEWVKANIAKFGGDPDRVTVFGESAGGGSIEHQITAYGGNKGPVPFAQAIMQSPGFQPVVSNQQEEQIFQYYLQLLNVSTIAEARSLPFSKLQLANSLQVGLAMYGSFTYGPAVDGNFVPALPGELLLHGQFDKSIRVMLGHNAQEVRPGESHEVTRH